MCDRSCMIPGGLSHEGDLSRFACDRCCVIPGGLSPRGRDRPTRAREEMGDRKQRRNPTVVSTTVQSQLRGVSMAFRSPPLCVAGSQLRFSPTEGRDLQRRDQTIRGTLHVSHLSRNATPRGERPSETCHVYRMMSRQDTLKGGRGGDPSGGPPFGRVGLAD